MQEIKERTHISNQLWTDLQRGLVDQDDFLKILEHTGECNWCAQRFADSMDTFGPHFEPPHYLKHKILKQSHFISTSITVGVREIPKKLQLLLYSFKVSAAVLLCVTILGLAPNGFTMPAPSNTVVTYQDSVLGKVNNALNGITNKINNISNSLF
jgi:hypothetical protein